MDEPTKGACPAEVFKWVRMNFPQVSLLWWVTPHDGFGGRTPMAVLEAGQTEELKRVVFDLEPGVAT